MSASPSPYTPAQLPSHGPFFSVPLCPVFHTYPAGSNILLFFLGTAVTTHFLSGSWYLPRARTQSRPLSVLTTRQSCHLRWNAQEALGTLDPPPSSKCVLKVGMAHEEGAAQFNPGLGKGAPQPSLFSTKSSLPFSPHASGGSQENLDNDTETDSLVSAQRERPRRRDGPEHGVYSHFQLLSADSS